MCFLYYFSPASADGSLHTIILYLRCPTCHGLACGQPFPRLQHPTFWDSLSSASVFYFFFLTSFLYFRLGGPCAIRSCLCCHCWSIALRLLSCYRFSCTFIRLAYPKRLTLTIYRNHHANMYLSFTRIQSCASQTTASRLVCNWVCHENFLSPSDSGATKYYSVE